MCGLMRGGRMWGGLWRSGWGRGDGERTTPEKWELEIINIKDK